MARIAVAALVFIVETFAAAPASAQNSWGVGVLPSGAIVFCDTDRGTVWRIDPDGSRDAVVTGVTCRVLVTGLDGTIYGESIPGDVTASAGVGLWQIDATGAHKWLMPPTLQPRAGVWLIRDGEGQQYSWTGTGSGSARSEIVTRDALGVPAVVAGAGWGNADGNGSRAMFGNVEG